MQSFESRQSSCAIRRLRRYVRVGALHSALHRLSYSHVVIVFEKDVAVELRDGVTIYVDKFRPVGAEEVPVIVAWVRTAKAREPHRA